MFSNVSLIQKADLSLQELAANGGKLQPDQAKLFWRDTILQSTFLQACTGKSITGNEAEFPKTGLTDWLLVPNEESTKLGVGDRSKPDIGKMAMACKTFKGIVPLSYEQVEENVENGSFPQTVRQMASEAAASNLVEIAIQGDTAIVLPDPTDKRARALKKIDGMLKQTTTNIVDAGGSRFNRTVADALFRKMPTRYREQQGMAYLTSSIGAKDYSSSVADRQTAKGDSALEKMAVAKHGDIPILGFGHFPENLGGSSNGTNVILANPKNFYIGMGKEITIQWKDDPEEGMLIIIVRVKFDAKWLHEPMTAKAINVSAAIID